MIQLVPEKRLSADEYLQWQRGNVFPECFYGSIYEYMQTLTQPQWGPADTKIDKYTHFKNILSMTKLLHNIFIMPGYIVIYQIWSGICHQQKVAY